MTTACLKCAGPSRLGSLGRQARSVDPAASRSGLLDRTSNPHISPGAGLTDRPYSRPVIENDDGFER